MIRVSKTNTEVDFSERVRLNGTWQPGSRFIAYDWFRQAMEWFEKADAIRLPITTTPSGGILARAFCNATPI